MEKVRTVSQSESLTAPRGSAWEASSIIHSPILPVDDLNSHSGNQCFIHKGRMIPPLSILKSSLQKAKEINICPIMTLLIFFKYLLASRIPGGHTTPNIFFLYFWDYNTTKSFLPSHPSLQNLSYTPPCSVSNYGLIFIAVV